MSTNNAAVAVYATMLAGLVVGVSLRQRPIVAGCGITLGIELIWVTPWVPMLMNRYALGVGLGIIVIAVTATWRPDAARRDSESQDPRRTRILRRIRRVGQHPLKRGARDPGTVRAAQLHDDRGLGVPRPDRARTDPDVLGGGPGRRRHAADPK